MLSCVDAPGWTNGAGNRTCSDYQSSFCAAVVIAQVQPFGAARSIGRRSCPATHAPTIDPGSWVCVPSAATRRGNLEQGVATSCKSIRSVAAPIARSKTTSSSMQAHSNRKGDAPIWSMRRRLPLWIHLSACSSQRRAQQASVRPNAAPGGGARHRSVEAVRGWRRSGLQQQGASILWCMAPTFFMYTRPEFDWAERLTRCYTAKNGRSPWAVSASTRVSTRATSGPLALRHRPTSLHTRSGCTTAS